MPSPLTRLRDREFYSPPSEPPADRFIPTRSLLDLDLARDSLLHARPCLRLQDHPGATTTSPGGGREQYRRWVEENLRAAGADEGKPFRMLPFRSPRGGDACRRSLRIVDDMLQEAKELDTSPARWRYIHKYPVKVLDAPGMVMTSI